MKPWFPTEIATPVEAPGGLDFRPQLDPRTEAVRKCLFVASVLSALAAILLPPAIGMRANVISFLPPFALLPSVAILWVWANWRGLPRARAAAELAVTPLLLSLPVLVFSYSAMRAGFPLQDARLEAWDSAFGFHALDFIAWVNRHPTFAHVLSHSYSSFFPQMIALPTVLVIAGRLERAYAMTFGVLLLGIIGSCICMFFPAVGVYVHHGIRDGAFAHVPQSLGFFNVQLDAVRTDPSFVLDVEHAQGIVSFPSGHAAMAVLCAWAAWSLRWVRWPLLALNAAMFVSAIPQGAHYLVDLIAGAAMAIAAILIATRLPVMIEARPRRSAGRMLNSPRFSRPRPPAPCSSRQDAASAPASSPRPAADSALPPRTYSRG